MIKSARLGHDSWVSCHLPWLLDCYKLSLQDSTFSCLCSQDGGEEGGWPGVTCHPIPPVHGLGKLNPRLCHTGTENGSPVASISSFASSSWSIKTISSSIFIWLDVEPVVTQSVNCECHFGKKSTLFYYLPLKKSPKLNRTSNPHSTGDGWLCATCLCRLQLQFQQLLVHPTRRIFKPSAVREWKKVLHGFKLSYIKTKRQIFS